MRISHAIAGLSLLGAIISAWVALAADNADTKRRVSSLEQQHAEQREEARSVTKEIKSDIKETKQDVQTVLRKLETLEALQRAADRRNR